MPVQTYDFIINSRLGPTSLADIKEYNAQLERMIELQKQAGVNFGPGGGGGGGGFGPGGGGGGGGSPGPGTGGGGGSPGPGTGGGGGSPGPQTVQAGSNSHNSNAASAGGLGATRIGGFDPIAAAFNSAMSDMNAGSEDRKLSQQEEAIKRQRQFQRVIGIQALGYGLEDLYYSGFRGVLNNLPFMAQGLASFSSQISPAMSQGIAGITALAATSGLVAYENRKPIADYLGVDLGTRSEGIFGLAERSRAEKLQEEAAKSSRYIDKYGRESALGRGYMAESARALAQAQRASGLDVSNLEMAAQINALTPQERAFGRNVDALGLNTESLGRSLRNQFTPTEAEIQAESQRLFDANYSKDFYGNSAVAANYLFNTPGNAFPTPDYFRDKARQNLSTASGNESAALISKAFSGNPESVRALQEALDSGKIKGNLASAAQAALGISQKMSAFDASNISALRASASNPMANVKAIGSEISNILSQYGNAEGVDQIMPELMDEMGQAQKQAPTWWQKNFDLNRDRYVNNIAASFGGIQANGARGASRATQRNNLQRSIVEDLINSGVPANRAQQLAGQLQTQGYAQYRGLMDAANMNNGFSNMQNFMMMLGEEQQMAFSEFQQNRVMIMMQQASLRRNAWVRSRNGLRGTR